MLALAAMLAGAVMLLVPALLKTRFGVDEVVTTLLFNFIFLLFISMLLEGPLKDPMGMGWPKSAAPDPGGAAAAHGRGVAAALGVRAGDPFGGGGLGDPDPQHAGL